MKLIYIGERFYFDSGGVMSAIYYEDGDRCDWGHVKMGLRDGRSVNIRPASDGEIESAELKLKEIKERKC